LKSLVAEVAEDVAVEIVGAGFGDDVDDAAGSAAVLRVVVAKDELEFLAAFLRDGGTNAVDGVIDRVGAIDADHVRPGAVAIDVEAGVGSWTDGGGDVAGGLRVGEGEVNVAAAVDGEIVDAALIDGLRDFGLRSLDGSGFGGDGDALLYAAELEARVESGVFTDGERDRGGLEGSEVATTIDRQLVGAGNEADETGAAGVVRDGSALGSAGLAGESDFCATYGEALGIHDSPGKSGGVDLGWRAGRPSERQQSDDNDKKCHPTDCECKHTLLALHTSSLFVELPKLPAPLSGGGRGPAQTWC